MTEEQINYCEFWVSANRETRKSEQPNYKSSKIVVNNSWNFSYLREHLKDYHDREVLKFFEFGWPLNETNTELQSKIPPNQAGA